MSQIALTTDWTAITSSGQSCSVWLDQQDDGASGSMDVRIIGAYSTPSSDDFTKARRVYKPADNNSDVFFNCPVGMTLYAKCKDGTATISVDSNIGVPPILQTSYSKDGILVTTYQDDYITRGNGFQFKKRISLTALQVLYFEVDISKHTGVVYSMPLSLSTAGGLVFIDSYNADSSTGGTLMSAPLNLDGLSSTVADTTIKTGVTVSGTPTNVREYMVGTSSTKQSAGGGTMQSESPKILDNRKPLYFKVENKENTVTILDVGFVWYELPAW